MKIGLFYLYSVLQGVNSWLQIKKLPTEHNIKSRSVIAKHIYVFKELEPWRRVSTFYTDSFRLEFDDWESFYFVSITPSKFFNLFFRTKLGTLSF